MSARPIDFVFLEDCNHVLQSEGVYSLSACSEFGGPYVMRAGKVPVGVFGFSEQLEPLPGIGIPGSRVQMNALTVAIRAMQIAKVHLNSEDPIAIRKLGRDACRLSRRMSVN